MSDTRIDYNKAFYNLWFPKTTKEITIIAPPADDNLKDAELTSSNYALLDRLGDRDSIYTLGKLLSRKYPKALIHLMSSENFQHQSLLKNYVIIGGPGGLITNSETGKKERFEGNEACVVFSEKIESKISYTDDCESLQFDNIKYQSEYSEKGYMCLDYGYFASIKNPFLRTNKIIMIHGSHTLGVLGSIRVFDDLEDSKTNYQILHTYLKNNKDLADLEFETFFKVEVTNGEPMCPSIANSIIIPLQDSKDILFQHKHDTIIHHSLSKLKESIESKIRIAINNTNIEDKKNKLEYFLTEFINLESISEKQLTDIDKLCEENPSIPEEYIISMRGILNVN